MKLVFFAIMVSAAACGSSSSDSCSTTQVSVEYLGGGAREGDVVCAPIPTACGTTASCDAMACISAMYDLCDAPYLGVGCSDTFAPTIISCNP